MTKSPTQNTILDRYLHAVRFWLPAQQQDDIIAELSEDLRSQIEEKESAVGHPLNEFELSSILKRCGIPIRVASRYQPQGHLIGPALFPIYRFVLKMVLLWVLLPVFLFIVGPAMLFSTGDWGAAVVRTLSGLWSGIFIAAGTITLIFAVLERTQASLHLEDKWDPQSLPAVVKNEHKTSRLKMTCEAVFAFLGFLWLLLVPYHPFLILGPAAAFLQPAPLWHRFYVPILLLALAGFVRPCIGLARPQWTWFVPFAQLLNTGLTLVFLYFILHASSQVPANGWSPFVILTDAAKDSAQYRKTAGIVNVSILMSMAGTWFGLAIASIFQIFEFGKQLRKQHLCNPHSEAPSPL
jgi:hypothetical protein